MLVSLQSKTFSFRGGRARLLAAQWDEPELLAVDSRPPDWVSLNNDQFEYEISDPGTFSLALVELTLARFSDHRDFAVPYYLAPQDTIITAHHLGRGSVTIDLEPEGVFRVVMLDRMRRPLRGQTISFCVGQSTAALKTNGDGAALFLGNPTRFQFALDAGTGMEIVPL